jgi:hypothetical protein
MKLLKLIQADINEMMAGLDAGIVRGDYDHDTYLRLCGRYQGLVAALGIIAERARHIEDEDTEVDEDEFVHQA